MNHQYRVVVDAPEENDHAAEFCIDTTRNDYVTPMNYYLDDESGHPPTVYRQFMDEFIGKFNSAGRYYGFIRLFIHLGQTIPISIFIRMFNGYVNGIHNGHRLFEIGLATRRPRYFLDCEYTGFTEQYFSLLHKGRYNLVGMQIGPHALRRYTRQIMINRSFSMRWRRSIAGFSLTFSEPGRLRWIKDDAIVAFEESFDITIGGGANADRYIYMAIQPKMWGDICRAANGFTFGQDTAETDPPDQYPIKTLEANDKLLTNSRYARAALEIYTIPFLGGSSGRGRGGNHLGRGGRGGYHRGRGGPDGGNYHGRGGGYTDGGRGGYHGGRGNLQGRGHGGRGGYPQTRGPGIGFFQDRGNISAKYVKPNFNTVFSSQEDYEGQKAQSQALSINAVNGTTSSKPLKPNFNTVFRSKQVSKIHKTQSQELDLIAGKENRDSEGHRRQFQPLTEIDGNTSLTRLREQVDQMKRPRRGIKKPTWTNEFLRPKSKASYQPL